MMETASCRSCGRTIVWTTSPSGARLPLDARAVTVYRILEDSDPPDALPLKTTYLQHSTMFSDAEPVECKAFVSHFLTCPNASQHSGGGRA